MHDDREFARHSYSSTSEAQPLAELEPPIFEAALSLGSRSSKDRCRRFKEQAAQMAVAPAPDLVMDATVADRLLNRRPLIAVTNSGIPGAALHGHWPFLP